MNPFEGLTREAKSIELGGKVFYFKPVSMGEVREIQKIKDHNELASQMIVKSICDKDGKPLEGFKAEYLSVLSPSELMEIVTFAQGVSMPSTEKKKLTEEEAMYFHIAFSKGLSLTEVTEEMEQMTYYEHQQYILYYRQFPPMHEHINNIGANIAFTVYQCNATKKSKKLSFEDFKLNYVRSSMDDEEKMLDDFAQFEKSNPKLFTKIGK